MRRICVSVSLSLFFFFFFFCPFGLMTRLSQGVDLNWQNPNERGQTLLHHLVARRSAVLVDYISNQHVRFDLADSDGNRPLHEAVRANQPDLVRLLLLRGARRTSRNRAGITAAELAQVLTEYSLLQSDYVF
jgi:ankyrin repeat protein